MRYCIRCQKDVEERFNNRGEPFCPYCGYPLEDEGWVSDWWYLLPLFVGVIGGLIAFALTFSRDDEKAKNFVILGVLSTITMILINWLLSF